MTQTLHVRKTVGVWENFGAEKSGVSFGDAEKSQEFSKLLRPPQGYRKLRNSYWNIEKCIKNLTYEVDTVLSFCHGFLFFPSFCACLAPSWEPSRVTVVSAEYCEESIYMQKK